MVDSQFDYDEFLYLLNEAPISEARQYVADAYHAEGLPKDFSRNYGELSSTQKKRFECRLHPYFTQTEARRLEGIFEGFKERREINELEDQMKRAAEIIDPTPRRELLLRRLARAAKHIKPIRRAIPTPRRRTRCH